jgi:transposase InsO family protein
LSHWRKRTGIALVTMLAWLMLSQTRYYAWRKMKPTSARCVPKSHWLLPWEVEAIIAYRMTHLHEGYRPLTYQMLDADIVAVSPASVYRVLHQAGLLWPHAKTHTKAKGRGFEQPQKPHEHWHLDISYINCKGTFVYLIALIDGYSRYLVHYEIRLSVEALDVELLIEHAREKFPGVTPVLITDNGPQFIAKDFKSYLSFVGITHRRTRFFYPQSNGKMERFILTFKNETIRRNSVIDLADLKQQVESYIAYYNTRRLHSAIGYVTPQDMLDGKQQQIFAERRAKLEAARAIRKNASSTRADLPTRALATSMRSEDQNQGRAQRAAGRLDFGRSAA